MNINDKKVFTYEDDKGYLDQALRISDQEGSVNITKIKEVLNSSLERRNINAQIEEGSYTYKVGALKSEKTTCLIVSHKEKPKNYRMLVVAIKQVDGGYLVVSGWYGESKSEMLVRKADKSHMKADKNQYRGEMGGGTESYAKSIFHSMIANSRIKKAGKLQPIEHAYNQSLREAYLSVIELTNEG
ncbi:MAG: hypothetical protein IJ757_00865 [Clostridiales bacterium]|nr:hypothetical protein [Clostridiales bacterium]